MPRSTLSAVLTPGERQAELDQSDGDGWAHADDHGVGVEDARYRGNVVEHAADEAVDDFQGRYIDEDALGAVFHDLGREIFLERRRQPVVHIDLDRDEQHVPKF